MFKTIMIDLFGISIRLIVLVSIVYSVVRVFEGNYIEATYALACALLNNQVLILIDLKEIKKKLK